jgi:hypothetical protein
MAGKRLVPALEAHTCLLAIATISTSRSTAGCRRETRGGANASATALTGSGTAGSTAGSGAANNDTATNIACQCDCNNTSIVAHKTIQDSHA